MKKVLTILSILALIGGCNPKDENKDLENLLLLNVLTRKPKLNPDFQPKNLKAEAVGIKSVKLTWDPVDRAVVYRIYYTESQSGPSLDSNDSIIPPPEPIDPTVVEASTAEITRINNVESPYTVSNLKLGRKYKFIVTAVGGFGESTPSEVVMLDEVFPTQKQRLEGIWVVGGLETSYSSVIAQVDLYDPSTNTWFPNITQMPTPVSHAAIVSAKKSIFVCGGFRGNLTLANEFHKYNILTDTWSTLPNGPACGRALLGGVHFANRLYFLGGATSAAGATWAGSNATDVFNLNTETWSTTTSFGAASTDRALALVDDYLCNFGGRSAAAMVATTHDCLVLDPVTGNGVNTSSAEVVLPGTTPAAGTASIGISQGVIRETWRFGGLTGAPTGNTVSGIGAGAVTAYPSSKIASYIAFPFTAPQAYVTPGSLQLPENTAYGSVAYDPIREELYFSGGNITTVPTSPLGSRLFIRSKILTKSPWQTNLPPMPVRRWGHTIVTIQ